MAALCVLLGIAALSCFVIAAAAARPRTGDGDGGYTVTLRHYGVDAREMERTAAIPLEDALASLPGVRSVLTSSEYSRVRGFVRFEGAGAGRYEAVREAAQGVYETLPRSAQRPEIVSSGNSRIPVWTAAVLPESSGGKGGAVPGNLLQRLVKPALEGLEGAGEVEISGTGLPEIVVALKGEEAAARSLTAAGIAGILGSADQILPGGILQEGGRDILVTVDGRYRDTADLAGALIPLNTGQAVRLDEAASVYEGDREPEVISRLDGKPAALIAVMGGSNADLGKLSRALAGELKNLAPLPLEFRVLSDRGEEERAAFRSVFAAVLQGAAAVALMTALLGSGFRPRRNRGEGSPGPGFSLVFFCALAVPLSGLMAAALVALLGIPLDRSLLAGLAVGIGAAVDAVILSAERLGRAGTVAEGGIALKKLRALLVSGSVTTIAALLPLGAMKSSAGEIKAIAWAVGAVTLVSMITALVLLPPLFLWRPTVPFTLPLRRINRPLGHRLLRTVFRLLARSVRLSLGRPEAVLAGALLFSIAGAAALLAAGVDVGAEGSGDSVYVQVEFDGGFRAAEADRLLAVWAEAIKTSGAGAVKSVQTSARTSSGSALVSFYPEKISPGKVRDLIRSAPVPGGFVYIPETSAGERIWDITISGDDDRKCRELAEDAARLCLGLPLIREAVLNFKEGSGRLNLVPRRDRFEEAGVSFSAAADTVRRGVHGPVAYKRISGGGETDVRVRGSPAPNPGREDIRSFVVAGGRGGGPLRLDSLMTGEDSREPSSIRREDRRRVASISLRTKGMDPRLVRGEIMPVLGKMELPPGYGIEFDREAVQAAEALSGTVFYFLLALLFCYMVIAAANESFGIPLAVLSVVPPSLAFPALCLAAGGHSLNAPAACAFVAVSGMAVNAAVLTADEFRRALSPGERGGGISPPAVYRLLRSRLPALLATSGTTIAGSVPFLFLREGSNRAVRVLALVTGLGVAASCLCSLLILPALAKGVPKIFASFVVGGSGEDRSPAGARTSERRGGHTVAAICRPQ